MMSFLCCCTFILFVLPAVFANLCLYAEISCGPPLNFPNTNLLWDRRSTPGSAAMYECVDGFYQESGNNISTCSLSGQWGEVSVKCKGRVIVYIFTCHYLSL